MRYTISDHPQGTAEWKKDRAGRATGSRAKDILASIKSGEAAARRDYRIQLGLERLTGMPADDFFVSKEMLWGIEQEPFARMAYEGKTGLIVNECGFICLEDFMAGCSVDGFVTDGGRRGVWEAKCPKSSTHLGYLEADRLPPEHAPQIMHNMWSTDAEFADFVSFDPRMPEHLQLFIHRVERNESSIALYQAEVVDFLRGVDDMVARLMKKGNDDD
jgi:hypothetical protein